MPTLPLHLHDLTAAAAPAAHDPVGALSRSLEARLQNEPHFGTLARGPAKRPDATSGRDAPDQDLSLPAVDLAVGYEALIARLPFPLLVFRNAEPLLATQAFLDLLRYRDLGALRRAGGVAAIFPDEIGDRNGGPIDAVTADGHRLRINAKLLTAMWRGRAAIVLVADHAAA